MIVNMWIYTPLRSNANDDIQFTFIENYCGHELELESETLKIYSNGESDVYFSLASFDWFDDSEAKIYLHCTVKICDINLSNCKPECSSGLDRRRRDISNYKLDINNEQRVDIGPIYLGSHNPNALFTKLPKY